MELRTDCLGKLIKKIKQFEGTDTDLAECAKNVYGRIVAEGEGSLQCGAWPDSGWPAGSSPVLVGFFL